MKIGSSDSPQPLATTTLTTSRANGADTSAAQAASAPASAQKADASTQVAISSAASALLEGASADFNAEKVAQVTAAIESGSFKPNPDAIADKLIANAQELLTKSPAA
jgi:negative regulator of flagellin synthesis FlgM